MNPTWAFQQTAAPINISASTTTASGTMIVPSGQGLVEPYKVIRIANLTSATAYWRSGIGAQTAVTTDCAIPSTSVELFTIPASHDTIAVILSTGTGTVQVVAGAGL